MSTTGTASRVKGTISRRPSAVSYSKMSPAPKSCSAWTVPTVAPEASVVYRFALAALILFAWCRFRDLSLRFTAREHGFAALMGCFMLCLNYALFYYAAAELTSGLVALTFSLLILFNALFGVLFL